MEFRPLGNENSLTILQNEMVSYTYKDRIFSPECSPALLSPMAAPGSLSMFLINMENKLAWLLLDLSFAQTATTLNKGTHQCTKEVLLTEPLQVVHDP